MVLAGVDMNQMASHRPDGLVLVFLFDIGVEGVVENADVGVGHLVAQANRVSRCVQEIGLKAVEWLDRELDAAAGGGSA